MEWARFGLDLFKAAVWPVVILVVIIVLRPQLKGAIDRIEAFPSPWGGSIQLRRQVEDIAAEVDRATGTDADDARPSPPPAEVGPQPRLDDLGIDRSGGGDPRGVTQEYADSQEGIAIMKAAWNEVRAEIKSAATRSGVPPGRASSSSTTQLASHLVGFRFPAALVPPIENMQSVAGDLQRRNLVMVTPETVEKYVAAAARIVEAARAVASRPSA